MKIVLTLPDALADHYIAEADDQGFPIATVMEGRLAAATRLDPRNRYIIVNQPELGQLEEKLGGGSLGDAGDLTKKVTRLCRVGFEGHEIKLTAGQLEELVWRSRKVGKPLEAMIQIAFEQFAKDFFTLVP